MADKQPQATAVHNDSLATAGQIDSHVSTAADTGKKSHQRN